ncbi:MAG: methionine--tRNA ligase [Desulfurococcales archaeon]|nr:methionine--tRNA ligase [Desulfurococcales archaeon]
MGKWVVTAAWPYINSVPHLGTILHLLGADIMTRFLRMLGEDVISVSGSDEHGTPIEVEARKKNIDPRRLTDEAHSYIVKLLKRWRIELDNYSRTESEVHKQFVREFMLRLESKGYIFTQKMVLPYCERDRIFLPDRFVEGRCPRCGYPNARGDQCENCGSLLDPLDLISPRCAICGSKPILKETMHWFFDLKKLENPIRKWLEENKGLWDNVRNYSLNWIKEGLKPRSITRDNEWGIEAPFKGAERKTIYVWFEALLGYLSASKEVLEKRGRLFEEFWYDKNTKTIYFIGKDNIPFHAVILPAMLIASDNRHPLPTVISSTEYLLYEGEKFSKSRRIGLWADEALYILEDPDYWRFSLVRIRPEERDTNFSWKEFMRIVNSELNDDIGNFIYRILSFIDRYFESRIPEPGEFDDIDREVINSVKASYNGYIDKMLETRIKQASEYILEIARTGNQYINRRAPWDEIKRDHRRAGTTMYIAINIVAILTLTLYPITPGVAQKIWAMIGFEEPIERTRYNRDNIFVVNSGRSIGKLEAPFKKLSQDFLARISIIVEDARKKAQEDRPPHLRF